MGFVFLAYFVIDLSLVVSCQGDCLERVVDEMTCCALSGS